MLGLALVATLSFSPADASTEAPIIVVTPAPAPEPAVVVVPASGDGVIVVGPQPALPATTPPPPLPPPVPHKPMMGAGLMASGVAMFVLGVTSQITSASSQAAVCKDWQRYGFNGVHGCFYYTEPWQTHAGTGFAFGSALVLTSIGAGALGQHDAWQSMFGTRRQVKPRSRVVAGAIFAGLGVGAFIAEGFLLRRETDSSTFCTTHECEVQRRVLYYAVGDAGAASMIAGFGMMSYGRNYRNNRMKYGRDWTVTPQASPRMLGATATMHF